MPPRPDVRVVGRRLDPESARLRDLLTRAAQPYEWLEAGTADADSLLRKHGARPAELPVVIDEEMTVTGATRERLVDAWGMDAPPSRTEYDLVIVGAGPAGLAAAVYAASDGLRTLLVDEDVPGGQASHTSRIENFFGFPQGIGGAELSRLAGRQAEQFGTELVLLRGVRGGSTGDDGRFEVELRGGHRVRAPVLITANGMVWRRLEVDGVDELINRGVYYGAGRSEAAGCAGASVVVVGAGNSAGQAVLNLADAGARVTMAVRGSDLAKSMSAYLVDRIRDHRGIDVRLGTEVIEVGSDGERLRAVSLQGAEGVEEIPAIALFLTIGGEPRTGWADAIGVELDRAGFVLTGPDLLREGRRPQRWPLARDPLALETSVPGLFAAGDVRSGSTKRVAAAVGEGSMAVALVWRRLEEVARGAPEAPGATE
jgi:thioredoxin reductase (NADPH)